MYDVPTLKEEGESQVWEGGVLVPLVELDDILGRAAVRERLERLRSCSGAAPGHGEHGQALCARVGGRRRRGGLVAAARMHGDRLEESSAETSGMTSQKSAKHARRQS